MSGDDCKDWQWDALHSLHSEQCALSEKQPQISDIANCLGSTQRRVILSLTEDWGKACCHRTASRMFWGVLGRGGLRLSSPVYLVEHHYRTDNCWRLSDLGARVKAALETSPCNPKVE